MAWGGNGFGWHGAAMDLDGMGQHTMALLPNAMPSHAMPSKSIAAQCHPNAMWRGNWSGAPALILTVNFLLKKEKCPWGHFHI
jgi:hypothetical protein